MNTEAATTEREFTLVDNESGHSEAVYGEAINEQEAAEWLFADVDDSKSAWGTVLVVARPTDATDDWTWQDSKGDAEVFHVTFTPKEPACTGAEHDWNHGDCCGSGVGVATSQTCIVCGLRERVDTDAVNPENGEQGMTMREYDYVEITRAYYSRPGGSGENVWLSADTCEDAIAEAKTAGLNADQDIDIYEGYAMDGEPYAYGNQGEHLVATVAVAKPEDEEKGE